jgi:NADH-quinone oxidoreductase subunit L
MGIFTAALTAFYMFRQFYMTFSGDFRGTPHAGHGPDDHGHHHGAAKLEDVYESPKVVTVPLIILAFLSLVGGFFNLPQAMGGGAWFHHWLSSVWPAATADHSHYHTLEIGLAVLSFSIALTSVAVAYLFYRKKTALPGKITNAFPAIHRVLYNKYYVDELYNKIAVEPAIKLSAGIGIFDNRIIDGIVNGAGTLVRAISRVSGWIDAKIVDGAVNGLSDLVLWAGGKIRKIQTGYLYDYFYYAIGGVMVIAILMILL